MKILFVGDAYCTHTARWISQLRGTGWDLHVFDPINGLIHEELQGVRLYTGWKKPSVPRGTRVQCRWPFLRGRHFLQRNLPRLWDRILPEAGRRLARLVGRLEPDCLHTLGLQHHGEALLRAREILGGRLPAPWIYSCRGSDIYYYRRFPEQEKIIRGVLESCDYYTCNCDRDVRLAREYGLRGEVLGLFQGGGGFPVEEMRKSCRPGPSSRRRTIAVKGLETDFGRAVVCIDALARCAGDLGGYTLEVYQAHPATREAARRLAEATGVAVEIVPRSHYREIWSLFGEARIAIGVSLSDGVPNTMIEAMVMGAFPLQTDPGGASAEWIEDGVNGRLIPPDDPEAIARAVTEALRDDGLVDAAAEKNHGIVLERVDDAKVRPRVLAAYRRVAKKAASLAGPQAPRSQNRYRKTYDFLYPD
jgi:hypothetical protein